MADTARAQKIADRIKTLTAANLEPIVKDPDLGFVTITDVRVTGDLQHASIFYTVFGDAGQRAQTARLLELNKGKLRSFVGKQLGIRLTPSLEFIADAIPETAAHLEDLLREARERDAAVAAAAAGAVHAGEADPYKKDREDDEDDGRPGASPPRSRVPTPEDAGSAQPTRPRRTASSSSTSRRAGPATTSWRAPGACARTRKVGHAGTLDPMATGVLVLGVGRATRLLTFLVGCDKDYTATIRLGQATLTDDAEGEVTASVGAAGVERDAVVAAARRAHRRHRPGPERRQRHQGQGGAVLPPGAGRRVRRPRRRARSRCRASRSVTCGTLDVDGVPVLDVDVEVTVSSGTYVRALARDLGAALGCGGHLTALRRTRVGGFASGRRAPARRPRGPTGRADAGDPARRRGPRRLRRARGRRGAGAHPGLRAAPGVGGAGAHRAGRGDRPGRHASWRCSTSRVPRHAASSCSAPASS